MCDCVTNTTLACICWMENHTYMWVCCVIPLAVCIGNFSTVFDKSPHKVNKV